MGSAECYWAAVRAAAGMYLGVPRSESPGIRAAFMFLTVQIYADGPSDPNCILAPGKSRVARNDQASAGDRGRLLWLFCIQIP